jgi:tRNA modification GTPase
MTSFSVTDPIAALATPWGVSAIAVIRTSGDNTLKFVSKVFVNQKGNKTDLKKSRSYSLHHGFITNGRNHIDEVLVAVYQAPNSYTGEDSAEIFCHGGLTIIQQILNLLKQNGFRDAGPGEFTQRAFVNGKLDLTRAEAVNEIIRSRTDKARAMALKRLSGSVFNRINEIKKGLLKLNASLEVHIDYPEDDIPGEAINRKDLKDAVTGLEKLLSTYKTGKIIQEGVTIAITGRTNAGKSTLFNLLLREDRAIVSDIHGTTRDYLEGLIELNGIPIRLFDTAGLRNTQNRIEQAGIEKAEKLMQNSHLILYIVDAPEGITVEDKDNIKQLKGWTDVLCIWNKIDIDSSREPEGFIPLSSKTGEGLDKLHDFIIRNVLGLKALHSGEPVIDSERQKKLLTRSLESLKSFQSALLQNTPLDVLAVDLKEALDALGEITGEVTTSEILDTIFSNFCVGK